MKIAVLSDVHGNVPALEAVIDDVQRWSPDEVIVNGDLVSRGPCSRQCLELMARLPGARYIRGNHETWVMGCGDRAPSDEPAWSSELQRIARWTRMQLGPALEELQAWQDHIDIDAGTGSLHVTHGSRRGNRDGIHPHTETSVLPDKLGDPRELFICSHTHMPMQRRFNGNLVVNTGSVGQPFDGDSRAAYGRFQYRNGQWEAQIARVSYDRAQAREDFHSSGFLEHGGVLARMIYREFQECTPYVARWRRRYMSAIEAGQISVADAVERYMDGVE